MSVRIVSILLFGFMAASGLAQNTEFNYNGRVNANGQPFNGTGQFKFSLVNKTGSVTYWANDAVTLNGTEPAAFVSVPVSNGFFSVNIGDTSIPGMAEVEPSIFNEGDVYLRTWFSDGSGFERLVPDRRVVNPGLLGIRAKNNFTIYVNSATGDDKFSGLQANRPKKTIQAAWNALPTILETSVTIQLANGIYRESPVLRGKTCAGDAHIWIRGSANLPPQVRVTGAHAGAETVAVRNEGFTFIGQRGVTVWGIEFDRFNNNAIRVLDDSSVDISLCVVHHTAGPGIYFSTNSASAIRVSEIYSTNAAPVYIQDSSRVALNEVYIHDTVSYGVSVLGHCSLGIINSRFKNMNAAVEAAFAGLVTLNALPPYSIIENCNIGYRMDSNATLINGRNATTFINVGTQVVLQGGAVASN